MKSSASESKPIQSRSKGEIPDRAMRKERLSRSKLEQAFLINSAPNFSSIDPCHAAAILYQEIKKALYLHG